MASELYEISATRMDGTTEMLGAFAGKVLLIVNVASACGLTPQYEGLETLYETYRDQGFEVLGFPANEFGAQEPGTNEEIAEFCQTKFAVQFPMYQKIVVKGEGIHPLYSLLTEAKPAADGPTDGPLKTYMKEHGLSSEPGEILWNFEKFLVDRQGSVVARFVPELLPGNPLLVNAIEATLAA